MKAAWLAAVGVLAATEAPAAVEITSPDKAVRVTVAVEAGRLSYRASFKDRPVIESSPLGIAVDQADLGQDAAIGKVDRYRVDERYPWRGVHSEAVNRCDGARVAVRHAASGTGYTVDVRVFDDGLGFRFVVPGTEDVRTATGYASITEAALSNYAGMALQAPSTWDRTIVLPVSEIGQIAAFARRSGDRWFLAVLNGPTARTVRIPLSFLGEGAYRALLVRDKGDDPVAVEVETRQAARTDSLELTLRAAGAFLARFWR
jgi:hypothetical protein